MLTFNGDSAEKIPKFNFNTYVWPNTDQFRPILCLLGTGIEAKEELSRIKERHISKQAFKTITCHSERVPEIARAILKSAVKGEWLLLDNI